MLTHSVADERDPSGCCALSRSLQHQEVPTDLARLTHAAPRHIEEFHNFGLWRPKNISSARVRNPPAAPNRLPRLHCESGGFQADL